jgi:HPt (histidine-containing phosphotransfer) domain-containing protein
MDTQQLIDPAALEKLSKYGPPGFIAKLVTMFVQNTDKQMAVIRTSVADGNGEQLSFAAHALKSSAGQVGAVEMHRLLSLMESLGKEGRLEDAKAELVRLEEILPPSVETLKGMSAS